MINNTNHGFSLMAPDHPNFLLDRISSPRQAIAIRNTLSNGLPSSMLDPLDCSQTPNGLLSINIIQSVGIHIANDTPRDCFLSRRRRNKTKIVQIISTTMGGIGSKD
jgi:hypothetical protein